MGLKRKSNSNTKNPAESGHAGPLGQGNMQVAAGLEDPDAGRCLRLLAEGTARNLPAIDSEAFHIFRTRIDTIAPKMRDQLPDPDKLALIRTTLQALEEYRNNSENTLRERTGSWRTLVAKLLHELLVSINLSESSSPSAAALIKHASRLSTADEIESYCQQLDEFLHPQGAEREDSLTRRNSTDRSTANDNVAGLLGGGCAMQRVAKMIEQGLGGYAVLFRLGCLDIIGHRFGPETVQDCIMAVSAYLIQSLHGDDAVYHWSDCSLLAVLQGRPSEQILVAELARILTRNRDITVQIGGRYIMLRIPLEFVITPISQMRSPEDLFIISTKQGAAA